ncbi:cupin-like domain-containing protein [Bradyrhizobium sp. CIAT3101]|uniref:cupin-like domain-containing protein n=1 Tax=Bradyrhizobium sp. CIAT3101 TaxID=439387 RepID=UPI0024B19914|nr:cupin-like domain-containing protein [Bradyrhizobium sp. CIAT3101]WFU79117.1 cupin-like domain-containing protein [Bradyrhizobium sp. CIAT3101]
MEGSDARDLSRPAILLAPAADFRRDFGKRAFPLMHNLAANPLFSLEALEDAAACWTQRGQSHRFSVSGGQTRTNAKFSEMVERDHIATAIRTLPHSCSYVKISNINAVNAGYQSILHQALLEVEDVLGTPIVSQTTWAQMTVFLSSPNIVTPYHIDHEANFLCQIAGEKDVWLFDPNDRELLPDAEIEHFYLGDLNGAKYRDDLGERGKLFRLTPGVAVHHPPLAPHWVRNGANVSISVSINFCMRELDRRAHIYQVNALMRKIGLHPLPPGRSVTGDVIKAGAMELVNTSRPKNYREAVFSGLDRLRAPYRLARKLLPRSVR